MLMTLSVFFHTIALLPIAFRKHRFIDHGPGPIWGWIRIKMENKKTSKLNKRALVFFLMLFSASILPFSGFLMHEATNHGTESVRFLSMGFHNVASIMFAMSLLLHLKFNWKPIINYLRNKQSMHIKYLKEMAIAGTILLSSLGFMVVHIFAAHL